MDIKKNKFAFALMNINYDRNVNLYKIGLLTILVASIIINSFNGLEYGIKIILLAIASIIAARETEILFHTHNLNIKRGEAKKLIKETYPEITGLVFTLLIPVGTPIFIAIIGVFIAVFIGKMVFGGFSFNPFNPALIGILFITISWPNYLTYNFTSGLTNYTLTSIFNSQVINDFAINLGTSFTNFNVIGDIGVIPLLVIFIILGFKKVISPIIPILFIVLSFLGLFIITKNLTSTTTILLENSFLIIALTLLSDPITLPYKTYGKVIYAVIASLTTLVIVYLGSAQAKIMFAILFANLFVPLLNSKTIKLKLGNNQATYKLVIFATICFILVNLLVIMTNNYNTSVGVLL